MPTTNTYEISLRLVDNTPLAVLVSSDGKRLVKPPVLMRGVPAILRIKLFKAGGLVKAAELSALYTGFRLVIANDFDDTTALLLVSDENGATVDAQNDCIVLPMSEMNTETLESFIGVKDRLDLGAELQLFRPVLQDEPIAAWQFPVGVQNRLDLTGTATPAPGSVNYYKKDEVYTKEETDKAIAEGGGGGSQTLILEAAPTASTEGKVGQRALVSSTGDTYICTAIDDTDQTAVEYTWRQVANESELDDKISTDEKGAACGVATLDENGTVPGEQLPMAGGTSPGILYGTLHLDAAPTTSTVGAFGQRAIVDSTGKCYTCTAVNVDDTDPQNPVTTYTWADDINEKGGTTGPLTITGYSYGNNPLTIGIYGINYTGAATFQAYKFIGGIYADSCSASYRSMALGSWNTAGGSEQNAGQIAAGVYGVPGNFARYTGHGSSRSDRRNIEELSWSGDLYIAGGCQQGITVIPAATTAYTLAEGVQSHEPAAAPTYTLPAVTDATRTHTIDLKVKFSSSVLTYSFLDSQGGTVTPLPMTGTIADGSVVEFRCTWETLINQWVIEPKLLNPTL